MNVTELLAHLQAEQDHVTARADGLRRQIADLTTDLDQTQARLDELQNARKVIDGITRPDDVTAATAESDTYQRLLAVFTDHPEQSFRARELHELLGLPTNEAAVNITRSRLGRLVRQGTLTQPGRGLYQKRT